MPEQASGSRSTGAWPARAPTTSSTRIVEEIEDRYGPMPPEVLNLVDYGRIRLVADRLGVESIDRQGSVVVFTFKGQGGPEPHRVLRLVQRAAGRDARAAVEPEARPELDAGEGTSGARTARAGRADAGSAGAGRRSRPRAARGAGAAGLGGALLVDGAGAREAR